MIDIKKAEEEFKKYTSNYDMKESHIARKVRHTFRVEGLCGKIAISLGMNEEEINLAKLIGLLHDIGRFEQYTRYKTYADENSIDHGDLGVEILEKSNYIRGFIETDKYDDVILKAIKNHNKYSIDKAVNEKEKLFCEIIRDADKLDIMYQGTCESWLDNIEEIKKSTISQKVLEQFSLGQVVDKKNIKNNIDRVLVVLAFIYDFNFKDSYKIVEQENYINEIIDRFSFERKETKDQVELARKTANEYINKKLKEE